MSQGLSHPKRGLRYSVKDWKSSTVRINLTNKNLLFTINKKFFLVPSVSRRLVSPTTLQLFSIALHLVVEGGKGSTFVYVDIRPHYLQR